MVLLSLLLLGVSVSLVSGQQVLGCFSSAGSLASHGTNTFQSQSACMTTCLRQGNPIAAVKGTECFCGDAPPPSGDKVPDTECNTLCAGYPTDICGGTNAYTVLSSPQEDLLFMSGTLTAPPHTPTATTLLGGIIVDGDGSVSALGVPSSTPVVASSVPAAIATSRAVAKASPSSSPSPSSAVAAAASSTHASIAASREVSASLMAVAAAMAIVVIRS
ncbi:hypothetical protein VTN96DRAFT_8389 [Rasamsonia emersonii]